MWQCLAFLPLAFALSMDSVGVGITYGMRRIRLPLLPTMVIAGCSAMAFFLSMKVGGWLTSGASLRVTTWIGAGILILLGSWAVLRNYRHKTQPQEKETVINPDKKSRFMYRLELKHLGLIIEILRSPALADIDKSGSISAVEAFFLGVALSVDSLGAGLAAVMMGLSPVYCSLIIGMMSALFIRVGMWFGFRYAEHKWSKVFTYLPGVLLISIGLFRLF